MPSLSRRLASIVLLGFSSGLPLALTGATLSFRLAEGGLSRTAIGLFSLVGMSYSMKFVWSPAIDHVRLPGGRRRPWALLVQGLLAVALVVLGAVDPVTSPRWCALAAVAVAFLSATQDIVIDGWRIESLEEAEQGAGAAATQWGYRLGMIASGAGALYVASTLGWFSAYASMSLAMSVGMVGALLAPDRPTAPPAASVSAAVRAAVIDPFADFVQRPQWLLILATILLYKLGDAMTFVMATPLYVDLGFSAVEVASVSNVLGVVAGLAGIAVGAVVVHRVGPLRSLLVCGVLQAISNLNFAGLALVGHDVVALAATIGFENFSAGLGSAAFVAWLSALCSSRFTATQYALLTSLASVGRTTLSAGGGWIADRLEWPIFFVTTTLVALPGLALVAWLGRTSDRTPVRRAPLQPGLVPDDQGAP